MGGYDSRERAGGDDFVEGGNRSFHGRTARFTVGERGVEILEGPAKVDGPLGIEAEVTLSQPGVFLQGKSQECGQRLDALPGAEVGTRDDAAHAQVREPFDEIVGLQEAIAGERRVGGLPGGFTVADQVEDRGSLHFGAVYQMRLELTQDRHQQDLDASADLGHPKADVPRRHSDYRRRA